MSSWKEWTIASPAGCNESTWFAQRHRARCLEIPRSRAFALREKAKLAAVLILHGGTEDTNLNDSMFIEGGCAVACRESEVRG